MTKLFLSFFFLLKHLKILLPILSLITKKNGEFQVCELSVQKQIFASTINKVFIFINNVEEQKAFY